SRVKFDERGDRSSKVEFYQLRNLVAKYDPISPEDQLDQGTLVSGGLASSRRTTGGDSQPADWKARPPSPSSQSPRWHGSVCGAVAVNFHYRKLRLIKMSSPLVNNVIGALAASCATPPAL
uniref:DWNN domain-containing protein n=1 Tax=Macrostomum lignano TaxID=282301 RepID=A0A1I8FND9_9PLAT